MKSKEKEDKLVEYWAEEFEDEEMCDFVDEECIGDKMFCEECSIVMGENEVEIK